MIEKFGGRKFIIAILSLIMLFVLVILGKIESSEFLATLIGVGGTYGIANVTSKFSGQ